ncbi:hypothetical protein AK812_SmicGene6548 [Symbiodinium microadriaticum]|uniref:Uncharacterized protein n=1 Tax=Symbiodinium microadriaticum TaxID=2951 RepID=A0A1Q9EQV6_SYMMI|nr:hypothetical protein AK812_SmicGene6548 [Symbiodinium microadriaticum]CAE7262276.1 unnamed protein product [Symbiodinium sp. KB8]CAE7898602.1 unnamed protein product [Symbiodinium microadriaticum]|mmetsp:Transcript_105738/g.252219  ORF Transcript_105738/g.252219 Transcript_105738/m.252219 type:complete len:140 (-) Transcript_105738:58-477(-)
MEDDSHYVNLQQAREYLEKNSIPKLLESLLARAVLERPPDLRNFLIESLRDLKAQRESPSMELFTVEDIETMFDMWDYDKVGMIAASKVMETLKALNCSDLSEEELRSRPWSQLSEVDKTSFVKYVRHELETRTAKMLK